MNVRMCSPYGEHFVCCTYNAPTNEDEAKLYATMTRVRRWDRIYGPIMRSRERYGKYRASDHKTND